MLNLQSHVVLFFYITGLLIAVHLRSAGGLCDTVIYLSLLYLRPQSTTSICLRAESKVPCMILEAAVHPLPNLLFLAPSAALVI